MARYIEPHVSSMEQITVIGSNSVQSTTNRVLCIFIADCGPLEPTEINTQSEFLKVYTTGGGISRKAHRSFFHALKHAQSMPLMCVRVSADKVTKGITNTGTAVYTKGDKVLNYVSSSAYSIALSSNNKPNKWVLAIGDYVFCTETSKGGSDYESVIANMDNPTPVVIDPEYNNWPETAVISDLQYFINEVAAYITRYCDMSIETKNESSSVKIVKVYSSTEFKINSSFSGSTAQTINTPSVDFDSQTSQKYNTSFVISPNSPSKDNIYSVAISNISEFNAEGSIYHRFTLSVESKGDVNEYVLSTYPNDNDNTGSNMYITSFNEYQSELTIIPIHDEDTVMNPLTETSFGATDTNTKYDPETIPLELLSTAISDIEELEGVRISLISDCGICMPAYQKKLSVLAETIKALPALSCPDSKVIAYVTNYVKGAGLDTSYAWWGYPWVTDKALVDFPVNLSAVCYYIERISANASGNQEFAPVFGKMTGVSTGRNLHYNATLAQRNELQSYNINPIHYSKADNIAYFTNDLTALSALNVLQEEQTRRLINKIRYEVDLLCESYLSYDWDLASCEAIKSGIANYFEKSIKTMLRTIEGDPSINVTLNGLNKVKVEVAVQPRGSIKYINVYYNVLSMAG